jgi:hypothetical protein
MASTPERRHVRLIVILLGLGLATAIGLGTTWITATRGINLGTLTIGAWTAKPRIGSAEIDPYSRAAIARSGELPIGAGDGIAFLATATTPSDRSMADATSSSAASHRRRGSGR